MSYTPEQAQVITQWVERCVDLVLTNDQDAYYAIRRELVEGYDDGWNFEDAFRAWLENDGVDTNSVPIMLLIEMMDMRADLNDTLVALFLDDDERADVERDHDHVIDYFEVHRTGAEYTVEVPALVEGDPVVKINMAVSGGGTVGKSYAGSTWIYGVYCDDDLVVSGDDLRSPAAVGATHEESAVSLAGFLSADAEIIRYGTDGPSELSTSYTVTGREFLETEGERLGVWNNDMEETDSGE